MLVEELDIPSLPDEAIDEVNAFLNLLQAESHPEDPPRPDELARVEYRTIPSFAVWRQAVIREADGTIVGYLHTSWERAEHNQHVIHIDVGVHPDRRRGGIGTALLRTAVAWADEAQKTLIVANTVDRVPAGEAFAEHVGARKAMVGHTNRLVLADVDRAMVERWVAEGPARAPGYSLVQIDGACPDDVVEKVVDVLHVMNTAPTEDLEVEDQVWTVEEMRELEKAMLAGGSERRYVAARHDATGEFVGFTESWRRTKSMPKTVWQWGTGVRPEHRGHALGKWMKAVNVLRYLDEWPEVEDVRTHNADSNDAMLGINHALGFKPYTVDLHWQIAVDEARR